MRTMAEHNVRHFVRHHTGKLSFVVSRRNSRRIDENRAAGQSESIDVLVVYRAERERPLARVRRSDASTLADLSQIVRDARSWMTGIVFSTCVFASWPNWTSCCVEKKIESRLQFLELRKQRPSADNQNR